MKSQVNIRICLILFLISLSFVTCFGQVRLQNTLNKFSIPLEYAFDSKIDTQKTNQKVYLVILDNLNLSDTTKVRDDGMFVLPLIIAGGHRYDFTVTLGKSCVRPSFSQFIHESLKVEAKRSGNFEIVDTKASSDYLLEITLKECQISAKYHTESFGYGHSRSHNYRLKPILGSFKMESRLLERNNLIFSNLYTSSKSSQPRAYKFDSENEMNNQLMDSFVKTASLEIKEIIESVISDVNLKIKE
jgi:hypothetical protein